MNKEEKKAVESLKIKAEFIGDNYSFGTQGIINLRNELKIVLNLIEKQQKELEQEKEKNEKLTFLVNCYTNEYFIEESKVEKDYIDDGFSGGNFDRPGFDELLNDIDKGKISTIITKDLSRLGRDFIETSYYIFDFFPKHNIRYIAINDCYDSADENNTLDEKIENIDISISHCKEYAVANVIIICK